MKNIIVFLLTFMSLQLVAQDINQYEFVMVPTKFDFQSSENEYRLNTLLKYRIEEYGFKAFYTSDQLSTGYQDRCKYLYVNVLDKSGMLSTKLQIVFKDCNNTVVFESSVGTSKEKLRKIAYNEALEEALQSVKQLNYKFMGNKTENNTPEVTTIVAHSSKTVTNDMKLSDATPEMLFAQPILNGFQLVDSAPKVVLNMFKTSDPDFFIAHSDSKKGILFKKNEIWTFEYYLNDKLIAEKLNIKF